MHTFNSPQPLSYEERGLILLPFSSQEKGLGVEFPQERNIYL